MFLLKRKRMMIKKFTVSICWYKKQKVLKTNLEKVTRHIIEIITLKITYITAIALALNSRVFS